ncbi:MAG: hypothetical protein CVT84_03555 [Alphaproteobacteria bacterium HGW-Alphaproteobacteria-6]|nr:MAG: hypothetical protein CVT84_03555 [Alphaproteobacteria bacterium HGW-Alphaproteobacteria-6]
MAGRSAASLSAIRLHAGPQGATLAQGAPARRNALNRHLAPHAGLIGAVWTAMSDRHLTLIAAGVAFYTMFAIFPGMAATIAIWGFFADPAVMGTYLDMIHGLIPDAAFGVLESQLDQLLAARSPGLGWATGLSLAVALYSLNNGVAALIGGLNAIEGRGPRPGLRGVIVSATLTLVLIAMVLAGMATVVVVPLALGLLPLGPVNALILTVLPWIVLFLIVLMALGLFYRWGPDRGGDRHGWITPGAVLAAALWAAASIGFSTYLAYFGAYNRIYGSIGAVIALLMWFYIAAFIVLLGAVLNAETARLRAQ